MPPKKKGKGKKGKKKSAKPKTPTVIDGMSTEEMSKEQLEEPLVAFVRSWKEKEKRETTFNWNVIR